MATERQKRALKEMVVIGSTKKQALIRAGYSAKTAIAPTKVTESKGFKELCEECGLTDKFILDALITDIKKKPQNRKPELELAVKIKGMIVEKSETTIHLPTPLLENALCNNNSPKEDTGA